MTHSITHDPTHRTENSKYVRLGEYNTDDDIDCIYTSNPAASRKNTVTEPDYCADAPVNIAVDSVAVSAYDAHSFDNDIAVIRLVRDVQYSSFIRPICLPRSAADSGLWTGNNLTVAGWGHTDLCALMCPCEITEKCRVI